MQKLFLTYVYSTEARLRHPEGYSSNSLAIVLWGDALSLVHIFCRNQLQSSVELLKLSNFRVVTYSLYFKLWIIASCESDYFGCASQLKLNLQYYIMCTDYNSKHRICFVFKHFIKCGCCGALAELCQTNTDTSRVKYSLAVILALLLSFWICHGGCTQGWLSV